MELTAVYYNMWYIAMYHMCIVPSARQLVWGGVWHNWAFVLHSPQLWINHPLFKAKPCILLCLTSTIARTLYLINVYHCLGGFAAQHTILHIWNYIGALLLAEAPSRQYPGPRHLGALVIGTKMGAYMCVTHCVDKASFRFHRKASPKVWKRYQIH